MSIEKNQTTELKNHIFLIGFMGSGKSSVARSLCSLTGGLVVEMDEQIEAKESMSISEIFEKKGEAYFRRLENALLLGLEGHSPCIVSCGGGVPMRQENVDAMKKSGKIVLLTASPQTILNRVKDNENRPLLAGKKNITDIGVLMEQRRGRYEAAADITVSTDHKRIEAIAREILQAIQEETAE